jgi:hypothetical protein
MRKLHPLTGEGGREKKPHKTKKIETGEEGTTFGPDDSE